MLCNIIYCKMSYLFSIEHFRPTLDTLVLCIYIILIQHIAKLIANQIVGTNIPTFVGYIYKKT